LIEIDDLSIDIEFWRAGFSEVAVGGKAAFEGGLEWLVLDTHHGQYVHHATAGDRTNRNCIPVFRICVDDRAAINRHRLLGRACCETRRNKRQNDENLPISDQSLPPDPTLALLEVVANGQRPINSGMIRVQLLSVG
jgi:hypothetical protein